MSSLTQAVVQYATSKIAVPPAVADIAKTGFIDCVACIGAGGDDDTVAALRRYLQHHGRRAADNVLALSDEASHAAADAALLDGLAAHAQDYDDVALAGHPSAVLVPAILAMAQTIPNCSGRDVLRAYVVGYEVWAELYGRDEDALHGKGWHPSSTLGLIGATAAVINLAGLPPDLAGHALGIACSRAGGLTANFGSGTKPLHIGWAASEAIVATQLASAGITAAGDVLEHAGGLLRALSPAGRARVAGEVELSDGTRYLASTGLSIKRYPVCYAMHRVLDGVLGLSEHPVEPDDIEKIVVNLGHTQASMLRIDTPRTVLESKFALRFCLAVALVRGKFGLPELDPALARNAQVARLMSVTDLVLDEGKCDLYPWFAPTDNVVVHLRDGRTLASGPIRFAKGHARNPMTADELRAKYQDCTAGRRAASWERLYARLDALESVPDIAGMLAGTLAPMPA